MPPFPGSEWAAAQIRVSVFWAELVDPFPPTDWWEGPREARPATQKEDLRPKVVEELGPAIADTRGVGLAMRATPSRVDWVLVPEVADVSEQEQPPELGNFLETLPILQTS